MSRDLKPDDLELLKRLFESPLQRFLRKRAEKKAAEKHVWFHADLSVLFRGTRHFAEIPKGTVEYFVCKLVFDNPTEYQTDADVLEAAGLDDLKQRTVYQAVGRVNEKAKQGLGLEHDLLERLQGKESTRLNRMYR